MKHLFAGEGANSYYNHQVTNYFDLFYVGDIFMGSDKQDLNVIWDTGSNWLMMETDKCSNCIGDTFDTTSSQTYQESGESRTITLGDGT